MFIAGMHSTEGSRFMPRNESSGISDRLCAVYAADPESSRIDPYLTPMQIQSFSKDYW